MTLCGLMYIYPDSPFLRVLGVFISDPVTDIVSEAIVSARLMLSPSVWNQNVMHQEKDSQSYFNGLQILLLHRNFVAMKYFRNVSMFDNRGSSSQGLWWRNDKLSCWDFSMKECILDGWGSLVTYTGDKWISHDVRPQLRSDTRGQRQSVST